MSGKTLKLAQQALRVSKRANANATQALNTARRAGPTGPPGPRGSEGLDGPQGANGDRGPRGTTGPDGPAAAPGANGTDGTDGADGADGATGPRGPQGLPGFVRAFGTIRPEPPATISARTTGITNVTRPTDDHFCISVTGDIDVATTSPVVSVDLGLSTGTPSSLFAAVDSTGGSCAAGQIAIVTAGAAPNSVGFTIIVP
jgi:Collagen triple helix repeat (20 copies)